MELSLQYQPTPNPNALRFLSAQSFKREGKATFYKPEQCVDVPLATALLAVDGVAQLHFFENALTVTKESRVDWSTVIRDVDRIVRELLPAHDAGFTLPEDPNTPQESPELQKIEEILDLYVRPALQGDGGDLQVLGLEGAVLKVHYEGACGSCPSATSGTLMAIERMLRSEYRDDIQVVPV
ncbi:MAG: NifU family protein [Calditrichaeota bacterium]|nr:NifU family protein [Calditrichota bacterium]MCB9474521.1 NifU family protein [Candidatus Delongbacteria bacterium]